MKDLKTLPAMILAMAVFSAWPCPVHASTGDGTYKPGQKLIVGVMIEPPYVFKQKSGVFAGLNVDIWERIARLKGWDYEIVEMNPGDLFESLKSGRIDLSIQAFFVMSERERYMDFSHPFGNTRLAVATLPEKLDHPWLAAIKIMFSWGTLKVFAFLLLALFVLGFILWRIERHNNPDHFGGSAIKGVGTGIYWVGSTLASGVCFGVALKSMTARILGLVWMITCALAISALIASLTAALSESRQRMDTLSDETLQEMRLGSYNDSSWERIMKDIGGQYELFNDRKPLLDALFSKEIDGIMYDEITLDYISRRGFKDRISVYPTNLKKIALAFGFPPGSPLRKEVNFELLSLMERPDWNSLLKRYGIEGNFETTRLLNRRRR